MGRAFVSVKEMLRGEFKQGGEDALCVLLDNTPFINLWYTREALNWAALYHLREMMSPGTLRRTERKLKEEYNQTYIISPARNIRKGGGFRSGRAVDGMRVSVDDLKDIGREKFFDAYSPLY
jgi:hypothetical protein